MKNLTLILLLAVFASGCSTQRFVVSGENSRPTTNTETTQHFVVYGISQTKEMNAAEICGGADKVSRVETHTSFLNGLLSGLTFGLYAPRQATVYCTQ
jgi:hypothetical protein